MSKSLKAGEIKHFRNTNQAYTKYKKSKEKMNTEFRAVTTH